MLQFHALATDTVRALQDGQPDYYDQTPETHISNGAGLPCRHCLDYVPKDAPFLILSYRPFTEPQPYAEVGPIFLCGDECEQFKTSSELPPILKTSPTYLIKGYTSDNRIKYGTGIVIPPSEIKSASEKIFEDETVAYIHVRSATNNCYMCLVTRNVNSRAG